MVQVFVSALNDALRDQRPLASSTDRGALMHLELLDTVNQSKRTIAIDRVKRSAYLADNSGDCTAATVLQCKISHLLRHQQMSQVDWMQEVRAGDVKIRGEQV